MSAGFCPAAHERVQKRVKRNGALSAEGGTTLAVFGVASGGRLPFVMIEAEAHCAA